LKNSWVPHDVRDSVVDYLKHWAKRTEIPLSSFTTWLEISSSKFYNWQKRYGKENMHNAHIPRDFWLEDWEKEAIIEFHYQYPLEGYRRLTFMMLDQDVVAVSPSTVYRILSQNGLLQRWNDKKPSSKGNGFTQPEKPHEHWHIDIAYLNICGTFYYLCTIIDGCSRYIVHWEIRESMKEADVEIILQRAREKYSQVAPRVISDNGPQFIAKDFKEFIRISGMTHVRTAPYYPQSNGKIERYHRTIKEDCIRPGVILSLTDAREVVEKFVDHYNNVRLHSAIGYVTPKNKLEGRERHIFKERDQKLEAARAARKSTRQSHLMPPSAYSPVRAL
jgi:transposase InsO family protein